ncbi:MAG: hypothetical protein AAFY71_19125 [Bacteroidota bacterium]
MLKRILIAGMLAMMASVAFAQVPLEPVVDLILKEKYGEAEKQLKTYAEQDKAPKNIDEVYYWLGKIQYINDSYEAAEEYFKKGLDKKSKSIMNLAGLSRIRMKENNLSGTNELLVRAAEADKGKVREWSFQRAEALLEGTADMVGDAKVILYGLRDSDDEDPRPNIYLGTYYKVQGVRELAYEELEKAVTKKPDYVPAYVYLAELKYEDGLESKKAEDFNKGLEYANKAIELDAEYASAYRIRAELYLLARRFQQARKDMEKYVSETQGDLNARVRFASFLYLSEEYDSALEELKAIEAAGLNNNVMRRLTGLSKIETGDLEGAKAAMDDYFSNIKEEFTIFQDYKALGDIYRLQGDLEKADAEYEKMILKNADKWTYYEDLAKEYKGMADAKIKESKAVKATVKEAQAKMQTAYAARKAAYDLRKQLLEQEEPDVEAANAQAAIMTEQKTIMEEAEAEAKELLAKSNAIKAEAKPFYPLEAHYRQKDLDNREGESYKAFFNTAKAEFNAGSDFYEKAEEHFKKCNELAPEQVNPYNYRLQISRFYEDADTSSIEWKMAEPAQDFYDVFGDKDFASISKGAKRFLPVCMEILTSKAFNPGALEAPTAEDLDCGAAKPLAEKLMAIKPNSPLAKSILDFCK